MGTKAPEPDEIARVFRVHGTIPHTWGNGGPERSYNQNLWLGIEASDPIQALKEAQLRYPEIKIESVHCIARIHFRHNIL